MKLKEMIRLPQWIKQLLLLIITTAILSGCEKESTKPKSGGEIGIALTGGLVGIDPIKDWGCALAIKFIHLIYSPLYKSDNKELGIAMEAIPSGDYKEWEFILRKDCYFHNDPCFSENTRLVNAYDVKYTYERARNIWVGVAPMKNIKDIIIIDSFRIKIILDNPDKNFLSSLEHGALSIVPFEAVEKYGDNLSFRPVGSGPFCFEVWNGTKLILIKNKKFWAKDKYGTSLPYLDKVIVEFHKDPNQCVLSLLEQRVDITAVVGDIVDKFFERIGGEIILKKEFSDRYRVIQSYSPSLTVLLVNQRDNPVFRNPDVVKALNYGINREALLKSLIFLPQTRPAYGPTLSAISGLKFGYDLKKAKELMRKSGYGNGLSNMVFHYYPNPFSKALAEVLQKKLELLNIKARFTCASRPTVLRGGPEWDFGLVSIIFTDSTSSDHLALYHSARAPWVEFKSPLFDSLWNLFNAGKDSPNNSLLLARLDSLVFENPPFVFLYWSYPTYLVDKSLQGFDPLWLITPYTWIGR